MTTLENDHAERDDPVVAVGRRQWLDAQRNNAVRSHTTRHRRERLWSWTRLTTFLAAALVWLLPGLSTVLSVSVSGVCLLLFGWSVHQHRRAEAERQFIYRLLTIIEESLHRFGGTVTRIRPPDKVAREADSLNRLPPVLAAGDVCALADQERNDLDLYADPVGVFGLLNRASTAIGSRRLRQILDRPCLGVDRILARQAAVRWLSENPAKRLRVMAAAAVLRDRDEQLDKLIAAIHQAEAISSPSRSRLMRVWSIVTVPLMFWTAAKVLGGAYGFVSVVVFLFLINTGLFMLVRRELKRCLAPWKDVGLAAQGYLEAARQAALDLPTETELETLRDRFKRVLARGSLPKLCRALPWADAAGPMHVFMNLAGFYDLHVAESILKVAVPNREALLAGLSALAETEALTSLACFAWEQPVTCYPMPTRDAHLSIACGVHPLIPPDMVVPNDVQLSADTRVWIVTGLNMGGKSTLLRMVGTNVLLAQIGSAVTARRMSWMPLRLMTDLRAKDDLARDESYFLAEVRQLRRMVMPPDDGQILLGLIDEPLRGTSSQEHSAASLAVVRHLMQSPHFFLVATHERRLTHLATGVAANYHFGESFRGGETVFDYRLHPGPADTRNAIKLLEREGYPASVIREARESLGEQST
ncbi:MAG TPA: hypothetical protein VMZ31_04920 [Phycisphaerae bacterium]|nr:hypothetical protein [Phycisphaerae bacterium]